jgi:ABC-type hemin transport system ATPase subunit
LADRIVVLVDGRITACGKPTDLTNGEMPSVVSFSLRPPADAADLPPHFSAQAIAGTG